MGSLVLVRHGQASFFADDYDRLSPLGEEQSRRLGAWWARQDARFDLAITGALRRQIGTAEHVAAAYRESRGEEPFPAPLADPAFDEYDADNVMKALVPEISARDAEFRALVEANAAAVEPRDRYRAFHRLLEAVMRVWVEGSHDAGGFETWTAFRDRVRDGLRRAMENAPGARRVVVFTSGGPIGAAMQTIMRSPDPMALELNWRVHNASITEFAFGGGRVTPSCFNSIPHLEESGLRTYR